VSPQVFALSAASAELQTVRNVNAQMKEQNAAQVPVWDAGTPEHRPLSPLGVYDGGADGAADGEPPGPGAGAQDRQGAVRPAGAAKPSWGGGGHRRCYGLPKEFDLFLGGLRCMQHTATIHQPRSLIGRGNSFTTDVKQCRSMGPCQRCLLCQRWTVVVHINRR